MPTIRLDQTLRRFAGNLESIKAEGSTVAEVLNSIKNEHPELNMKLYDSGGNLQKWLTIWVDQENIRFMDDLATKVNASSDVYFLLGGSGG